MSLSSMTLAAPLALLGGLLAAAPAPKAPAAPPAPVMPPAALKGEPKITAGAAKAAFVWVDPKGIHVRWSSDGKPALFSGTLELDKPFKEIKRVNALVGGFADSYGERVVLFSATARKELDGFDLVVPPGTNVKFDAKLDGEKLDPAALSFGEALAHPKELPVKFAAK